MLFEAATPYISYVIILSLYSRTPKMAPAPANFLHTKWELSSNKHEDSAHFLSDSKPSKGYKMRVNFALYTYWIEFHEEIQIPSV